MLLERIYDEDLAQAGYFIGCQTKGEAVVITRAATSRTTWRSRPSTACGSSQ